MRDRYKDLSWFLSKIKEPMFCSSVIRTERRAIFKPYILSSSKRIALNFEGLTAYQKEPWIISHNKNQR